MNKGGLVARGRNFGGLWRAWATLKQGLAEELLQFTQVAVLASYFLLCLCFQERLNSCNVGVWLMI